MDYIAEILLNDKESLETINDIIKDYVHKKMRYDEETNYLRFIILQQLNLLKNSKKGKLEIYSFDQLFVLLLEEVYELREELNKNKNINYERLLNEVGDIGAFLVGFVAKTLEVIKNENNN